MPETVLMPEQLTPDLLANHDEAQLRRRGEAEGVFAWYNPQRPVPVKVSEATGRPDWRTLVVVVDAPDDSDTMKDVLRRLAL